MMPKSVHNIGIAQFCPCWYRIERQELDVVIGLLTTYFFEICFQNGVVFIDGWIVRQDRIVAHAPFHVDGMD